MGKSRGSTEWAESCPLAAAPIAGLRQDNRGVSAAFGRGVKQHPNLQRHCAPRTEQHPFRRPGLEGRSLSTPRIGARHVDLICVVFILIAAGAALSWTISYAPLAQAIIYRMGPKDAGPLAVLLAINLAFFLGCMFVDSVVVMLILARTSHHSSARPGSIPSWSASW